MEYAIQMLRTFLSNPWVVGIGGGTFSGLLVAWASRKLFSNKEDKEYAQKIASANQEVIYSLRPLISEAAFPTVAIVDSMISATSRKYKIEKKRYVFPVAVFSTSLSRRLWIRVSFRTKRSQNFPRI